MFNKLILAGLITVLAIGGTRMIGAIDMQLIKKLAKEYKKASKEE